MSVPYRVTALLLFLGAFASGVSAQDAGLAVEASGGLAVPMGSFSSGTRTGEGASAGASVGLLFALKQTDRRSLYAGFSQHRFGCDGAGCATDQRHVATGFNVGVRMALLTGQVVLPWIRLGAITTRVETPGLTAPDAGVSDLGVGGEVGLGVIIGQGRTVSVDPSVVYSVVNSTLPGGDSLKLRYLVAQLGLSISF